jgi:2-iminoacetate synthase
MKFNPEKYKIADEPGKPFIDHHEILQVLDEAQPDKIKVRDIVQKSLDKNRLNLEEVAALVNAEDAESIEMIKEGAAELKTRVYGKRIVLFAPLYVGNKCCNDCQYCGFRKSNKKAVRKTLSHDQLIAEVKALENAGQKRLILVFGEHPDYDARFIADTVKKVYEIKEGNGEIRRVNINAAPLDVEGFELVKDAGIGTYQIFQETYHRDTYAIYHPSGKKSNFDYRLTGLDRAFEAGIDDVGIGALFGLYDWRFEVLGLVRHTNHLEACFNVGPHTISFPRLQDASNALIDMKHKTSNDDFTKLVAILRLAVPYTGMILTAREPAAIRSEILKYGVSQIDGGTKIEIGAYSGNFSVQDLKKEQFRINDDRSLNEVIDELIDHDSLPSFCTACYRLGRTGEHFMEFSVPGFIKRFCTPNSILTLAEYLEDYAPEATYKHGWDLINRNIGEMENEKLVEKLKSRLEKVRNGQRDLYF